MNNVNQTYAQDSPSSQEMIVPINPSYVDEKDKDKLIQKILLDLSFEKEKNAWNVARIKQVEGERDSALSSRDEWKALFSSEQIAHNKSREAMFERDSEVTELNKAINGFQSQRGLDKDRISRLEIDNSKLKSAKWKWLAGGLIAGAATVLIANK